MGGRQAVVSIRLPKPEAALAQLCFEESLFLCSEKDSDLEVGTRESWALESHGHLGQQTATGSQGPGRALIREPFSPGFMGGVSRASAVVCTLGRTEHLLGVCRAVGCQVFLHQHTVPASPPSPICTHVDTSTLPGT